jgi:hypothetical protein
MANETIFRDGINVLGVISGSGSINVAGSSEFGDFQTDTHRFTGSLDITGSGTINGSPIITEADTGSIVPETASYSLFAETASIATSASHAVQADGADTAISASHAVNADTASFVLGAIESASFADFALTASHALNVYISQSGQDVVLGVVSGSHANFDTVTANTLYITETTRSVLYSSGSTKFGDTFDDTHEFTGSVSITGSGLTINGNDVITTADTSSMTVAFATSASHAVNSDTASYFDGVVVSASYADFAMTASHALNVYISQSGQDVTLGTVTATNISASGWVSASAMVSVNTLDVNGASYTTNENADVDIGTTIIDQFDSGGLCSAEWLACIKNVTGNDYRTSKVLAVWNNLGEIESTEYSTNDIGNTNKVDLEAIITGSNIALEASVGVGAGGGNDWMIKVNRITI